ncbi:sugar nucleotide-binding protein [Gryllotalpicola protaetiae]|uniref:dTDP-4-dehydrorhamnose reductase n=1 Tax=Gryllotalpicola protaetiae TaxID=2419771 RepID=A0A387BPY6_9MICO|nr:bifunctional dTDP-4-dehydrorhamnose 3,5-epimerase family protein/NAD(P)-dependent oxidoreductase [Gryllotalpicola protaetiae]AYG03087.1 NAD-dependent epimerase/dehydratase family protein [Gryllotalpicola protaetiae]
MSDSTRPALHESPIPGLFVVDLDLRGDNRGWFKENWQREKMLPIGLPDFGPVQNNVSFNDEVGTTRGIHAEPWDKFVSVVHGRVFGAWVDLREGSSFGTVFTVEIGPETAVFVPRGVGNAYQTLEPNTVYSYLVNDHWSPDAGAKYTFLNLADETAAIDWPIPLDDAVLSDKDRAHPRLAEVRPMPARKTLVLGANGQLGRALRAQYPDAEFADRGELDITASDFETARPWRDYGVIINAAAYTKVDEAETDAGRAAAWSANVTGVAAIARVAAASGITLVHVSSDYVFDGTAASHPEDEAFSPLGVYGQTKAAGDAIVATVPRHYIVRTSWVIGDGNNFVRTMASLAERGIAPSVVDDQIGRLSFTSEIAAGIRHLIDSEAAYGTYNLTGAGEPASWAEIARRVFAATGHDAASVTGVTTAEYFAGKQVSPRPLNSVLPLGKIEAAGFSPRDHLVALDEYLANE